MIRYKFLIVSSLLGLVSACAPAMKPQDFEQPKDISVVDHKIAEAVSVATNANAAIAELEVAVSERVRPGPSANIPQNVVMPPESIQPITVDWNGPAEPLLTDIASRAGYTFSVVGNAPANPAMVSISAKNEPLFGVVRRLGNQLHSVADIGFNPQRKIIELRYGN